MYVHVGPCTARYIGVHVQYTYSIRRGWIVPISPCIQPHPDGVGSCILPAIMPPCHLPVCASADICKVSEYSLAHTARTDPSPCCDQEWLYLTVQHLQLGVLRPSICMYRTVHTYIRDIRVRAAARYRDFPSTRRERKKHDHTTMIRMPRSAPRQTCSLRVPGVFRAFWWYRPKTQNPKSKNSKSSTTLE